MKNYYLIIITIISSVCCISAQEKKVQLSEFPMSNLTSPAFQLLEETVTDIYTPENLKALSLHVQNNFGESMAIEVSPYFFINTKSKKRTYDRYIGVSQNKLTGDLKQNPFSGLNTTTLSFAYLKKDFETIAGDDERKTFSIAARTTLLRFFDKEKIYQNKQNIVRILTDKNLMIPDEILQIVDSTEQQAALERFFLEEQKIRDRLKPYEKIIKPIFKLDAAVAYSDLFKGNSINGGTINRFGSWLTGEFNLILNEDDEESSTNNYANLLFIGRYIEDGFNMDSTNVYTTNYYRDFGSKLSFEFGKFRFGYEFIKRSGTIKSERSVGNISFMIDKNISITGAFGKDFQKEDNLLALFGINWGLNFGNSSATAN